MFEKNKKEERFTSAYGQTVDGAHVAKIIVDKETGVNYLIYLVAAGAGGCGITPLLDGDGKPIITKGE